MGRKYRIYETKIVPSKEIKAYGVSDTLDEEEKYFDTPKERPSAAVFPISVLHDKETQYKRAVMLCDYLNKIQEITDHAISQTALVDILSANPTSI